MIEFENIKLTDLIEAKTLQAIQDGFSNTTGMAALTTDETGEPITKGSNFTDFCMNLTRRSGLGCQRCEKCDRKGGQESTSTGRASVYSCHAGLVDFAAPIMLNGKFIGSFIGGQVLTEPADENKIRKYAEELGIDPEEYIKAVRKVKIVPRQQIEHAANFLCTIANLLSDLAYRSYISKAEDSIGGSMNADSMSKIFEAENLIKRNSVQMNMLKDEFKNLEEAAEKNIALVASTMETVRTIQDIATNTRILGFNAYVEASHAKENGKGFGVITQEIRSLADLSMESADKIENAIQTIRDSTKQIDAQILNTHKMVNSASEEIEAFLGSR